jgi:hypothetical protein
MKKNIILILIYLFMVLSPTYASFDLSNKVETVSVKKKKTTKSGEKTVHVKSYTRKDGTKVKAHTRKDPGKSKSVKSRKR